MIPFLGYCALGLILVWIVEGVWFLCTYPREAKTTSKEQ